MCLVSLGTKVRATAKFTIRSMSVSVNSSMAVGQVAAVRVVQNHVEILAATDDEFDGVIVEMNEPMDSTVFGSRLTASICQWRQQVVILIYFTLFHYFSVRFQLHLLIETQILIFYAELYINGKPMYNLLLIVKYESWRCLCYNLLLFMTCNHVLQGKKGIWIKVPIKLVNLVEPAVKVSLLVYVVLSHNES